MNRLWMIGGAMLLLAIGAQAAEADPVPLLKKIKSVGAEGVGNAEASAAWQELVKLGPDALFPTLTSINDASPVASNWLRLAAEAIFENEKSKKKPLPAAKLEAFVKESKNSPTSRRLAYELLVQADADAPKRLLPNMIEDPSVEIRREAIVAALEKATPLVKDKPDEARLTLEKLFVASRDKDQAEKIAATLKELKVEPNLTTHFGVITQWHVIGPFDSSNGAGFAAVHDPEKKVDLKATLTGSGEKQKVSWAPLTTTDTYGVVDFNKAIGKFKDSVAYAYTSFTAEKELPIEIRFGCIAAVKIYLNGKEVFAREEYHHGQRFDQYKAIGNLKAGKNELLVKVCQNNQTESWAQDWKFQLRICDATGGAVAIKVDPAKQ